MSQISKLNYVDSKLGANTKSGQQTTRVIYDTAYFPVTAGGALPKYYEFFVNSAGKTKFLNNLPTGKLDSGEAMVVKEIWISQYRSVGPGFAGNKSNYTALLNLFVGNQCVVKDFNLGTQWGAASGPVERLASMGTAFNVVAGVRLLTDIVIPPQVNIKATIQYGPGYTNTAASTEDFGLQLQLSGYGVLFNPGMSL